MSESVCAIGGAVIVKDGGAITEKEACGDCSGITCECIYAFTDSPTSGGLYSKATYQTGQKLNSSCNGGEQVVLAAPLVCWIEDAFCSEYGPAGCATKYLDYTQTGCTTPVTVTAGTQNCAGTGTAPYDLTWCYSCSGSSVKCSDFNLDELNACTGNPGVCSGGQLICPDCATCGTKTKASDFASFFPELIIPDDLYCLDCAGNNSCSEYGPAGCATKYLDYTQPGCTTPVTVTAGTQKCAGTGAGFSNTTQTGSTLTFTAPYDLTWCYSCSGSSVKCSDINLLDLNACTGNPGVCSGGQLICPDCATCGTKTKASDFASFFPNLTIPDDLYCLDCGNSPYAKCSDINLQDLNACTGNPGVCPSGQFICPDCATCGIKIQASSQASFFPKLIIPDDLYCLDCVGTSVAKCSDINLQDLNACTGNPGVCPSGQFICPDCATCGTKIQASSQAGNFPKLTIPDDLYCLDCGLADPVCGDFGPAGCATKYLDYTQTGCTTPVTVTAGTKSCNGSTTAPYDLTWCYSCSGSSVKCSDINLLDLNACTGNPGVCSNGQFICPDCATCGIKIQASSQAGNFPNLTIPDDLYCLDCVGTSVAKCSDINLQDLNACTGNPGVCPSGQFICGDCATCGTKIQASSQAGNFPKLIIPDDLYCLDCAGTSVAKCSDINLQDLNACTGTPGVCFNGQLICPDCTTCGTTMKASDFASFFPNLTIPDDLYCLDCAPAAPGCGDFGPAGCAAKYSDYNQGGCTAVTVTAGTKSCNGSTTTLYDLTWCYDCSGSAATCTDFNYFNDSQSVPNCSSTQGTKTTKYLSPGTKNSSGAEVDSAGLTCWYCDTTGGYTSGDCTHWGYESISLIGCTTVTVNKGDTISGAGGVIYEMYQTTTCYDCTNNNDCTSLGFYQNASDAPCSPARVTQTSGGSAGSSLTCYHCNATCQDFDPNYQNSDSGGCSVMKYKAGNGINGYTFPGDTDCWDCGTGTSTCTCSTCTQAGGGSYYGCENPPGSGIYTGYCEYWSAGCGDFNLDESDLTGPGYKCTAKKVNAGSCSSSSAWAPYDLNCFECVYSSTPFAPVGVDGEDVFIGLDEENNDSVYFNKSDKPSVFAAVGVDGINVYIGPD